MLSHSRLQTFKTCPRKYHHRYISGIESDRQSEALRVGGMVHEGLDVLFRTKSNDEAQEHVGRRYAARIAEVRDEATQQTLRYESAAVLAILSAYHWYWQEPFDVEASELPFEVALPNGESLSGIIDKIVTLTDARRAVGEHKTTAQDIASDSDYWLTLPMNHQISIYMIAAKATGRAVDCVVYDVIRKPGERPSHVPVLDDKNLKIVVNDAGERLFKSNGEPYQAGDKKAGRFLRERMETPDEYATRILATITAEPEKYFQRREIARTPDQLEECVEEVRQAADMIALAHDRGLFPRNTDACCQPGRKCEFLPICARGIKPWEREALPEGFRYRDEDSSEGEDE